jgi:hypothetical protein
MKVGVDDFLAAGHDRAELEQLCTEAEPWLAASAPGTPRARSQATRLVTLAADTEFFHTPDGSPYATIPVAGHRETWPLRGSRYRAWLRQRFFDAEGGAPGAQALQDALGVLEGEALFRGPEQAVAVRLVEHAGAIYLDLGDPAWRAVEITAAGWRVDETPPVKFRRPRGLLPLPEPTRGGQIAQLRPFVNVADEAAWRRVVSWLIAALRPHGPYVILDFHGEQGSAKSTTSRVLRHLLDPNAAPLRAEPRDGRDLMIAASNGWIVAFDNLSRLDARLSDALCRLATGGGFATRALYTDDEEMLFDAMRPIVVNGINELAVRSDLLDRALVEQLPTIPEAARRPEAEFWRAFEAARPAILGALCDAASRALADEPTLEVDGLPRMADFTRWAVAAAPALGWTAAEFLEDYRQARTAANSLPLEASLIVPCVQTLAARGWEGTAAELLAHLNAHADETTRHLRGWPRRTQAVSGELRRLAPNLRATGVAIGFRVAHGNRKLITIRQCKNEAGNSSSPSSPEDVSRGREPKLGDDAVTSGDEAVTMDPPASSPAFAARMLGKHGIGDDGDDGDEEIHPCSNGNVADADEVVEWTG